MTPPMRWGAAARARLVVVLALAGKMVYLAAFFPSVPNVVLSPDSSTYLRPARALLETGSFSPSPAAAPSPEITRTPAYPALIAAVYAAFGERNWLLGAVSALLAAGTGLLLFRLTSGLFGESAGLVAVVLYSIEPSTFHYSTMILTETPFVFLLVLALTLWAEGPGRGRFGAAGALAIGATLGTATLVRPILYYALVPAALLAFGSAWRDGRSVRRAAVYAALLFLPIAVLVGGWKLRNLRATGDPTLSHAQTGNLRFCREGAVLAMRSGLSMPAQQEKLGWKEFLYRFGYVANEREAFGDARYADLFPGTAGLPLVELSRRWREEAVRVLAANPGLTFRTHLKGLVLLFTSPAPFTWAYQLGLFHPAPDLIDAYLTSEVRATASLLASRHRVLLALCVLSLLVPALLYAGTARGLFRISGAPVAHLALLGVLAYYLAVMAAPESLDDRYRVPMVPILCVYAGAGLAPFLSRAKA